MKYLLLSTFILLVSCNRKSFVEHKAALEEKGDCNGVNESFNMTSNFGGERFEFDKCLPAGFDVKKISTSRQGDTVLVKLNTSGAPVKLYRLTLDIDSYPAYHFITIDQETFAIGTTED